MGVSALVKAISRRLESVVSSLTDALPPYQVVQGVLDSKETGPDSKCFVHVAAARIEVDEATFGILEVGDMLKVRYTRGDRAINIDRYVPLNGQQ